MFRAFAAAALLCLPLPAMAQDMPLVDHVANLMFGLQAGYRASAGDLAVPIKQLGPGAFEVSAEGQRTTTTTITELEPCVFNYEGKRGTRALVLELQFRKLINIGYKPGKTDANGLTSIVMEEEVEPTFITRDGEPVDARLIMQGLQSDIPVASLEASVAALKAACPAGDPLQDMALVDHVAGVLFGLHNGYNVPVAGRKIVVQRISPGVFNVIDRSMHVDYTLSVSEAGTCLFDVTEESRPLRPMKSRVDATKLTSVSYTPTGTSSGITTYAVEATLEPGFKIILNADGTTKPADDLAQKLETDAPLELLEGSVAALKAACP